MKLKGKTALVTGGSTGLGFSIAKRLLEKEMNVAICGRKTAKLKQAKEKLSSNRLATYKCDISNYSQIEEIVDKIGDIDVLINNAGIWLEGELRNNTPAKISQVIDINLKGTIFATKAVLTQMEQRNSGFIINVSSTSGMKPRETQSIYAASKFGIRGFTDSLKIDLKDTNIKVTGFYPGGMSTRMFAKAGTPKENKDWMDTDKVAEIITFILERDESLIMDHVVVNKRGTKTSN